MNQIKNGPSTYLDSLLLNNIFKISHEIQASLLGKNCVIYIFTLYLPF
jgi:hypothetical protein